MKDEDNQKNPISGRNDLFSLPEKAFFFLFSVYIVMNMPEIMLKMYGLVLIFWVLFLQKPKTYQKNGGEKLE